MRQSPPRKNSNETQETEKATFQVVKRIREAILDEVFKPGDRLGQVELAEKFEVSRSPVRETLLALEKEGTLVISPYRGAIVKPLSAEEILDIAELRLALICLALKLAYRHLSPADFEHAYDLAKQLARTNNAKDHYGLHHQFWDSIFSNRQDRAGRAIVAYSVLEASHAANSLTGGAACPTAENGSHIQSWTEFYLLRRMPVLGLAFF